MNQDSEKIKRLQHLLSEQIMWYKEAKALEDHPDEDLRIDNSYIYDEMWTQFDNCSRGELVEVIQILAE